MKAVRYETYGRTMGGMGVAKVNQEDLATLSERLQDGKIAPFIDRRYPLH